MVCLVLPGGAFGAEPEADKKKLGATWTVTRADTSIGAEELRLVVKADGRRFMSFIFNPPGATKKKRPKKPPYRLSGMLWRDGAGQLTKYSRVEDRRLGEGVRVFRRGKEARIVGVNARKDMSKVTLTDHVIIDPAMWGTLWDWLPRIRSNAATDQTVTFIDIKSRKQGKAIVRKGAVIDLTNRKGKAGRVTAWTISGTGIKGLTLYLDAKKRLVGARSESRAMLLKGWSWEAPAPAPAPGDDATPPEPPKPDAAQTP